MEYLPRRFHGLLLGAGMSLGMLVLSGLFVRRLLDTSVSSTSFVLGSAGALTLLASLLFTYWTYSCWRLKYAFENGSLIIRWGAVRHVVPLNLIEKACLGNEVEGKVKVRGLNWAGYHVGWAELGSLGQVVFYSTHRSPRDLVYLLTPGLSYAISPPDPQGFLADFVKLSGELTGPASKLRFDRWFVMRLPFWKDRYAQAVVLAGFLVNAALFAYVTHYFPSLPELLPMHFTVLGDVDLIGVRSEVLKLPVMAFVVFLSNLVFAVVLHAKERVAAYLCLAAAFFVQIVFWVATTRIVY